MDQVVIDLKTQRDLISARQVGREMANRLGFGLADQTRLVTAISELARNTLQYAGEGTLRMLDRSDQKWKCIFLEVVDQGPGIPDLEKAMSYGFTTGNSMGAGLPGVKGVLCDFSIESRPGFTRVAASLRRSRL